MLLVAGENGTNFDVLRIHKRFLAMERCAGRPINRSYIYSDILSPVGSRTCFVPVPGRKRLDEPNQER